MLLPTKKSDFEFAIWGASCYLPHCSVREANVVHLVLHFLHVAISVSAYIICVYARVRTSRGL